MASGRLIANDDSTRAKHRWGESIKVYTRKHLNKSKNPNNVSQQSSQTLATVTTAGEHTSSLPQPQPLTYSAAASDDFSSHNPPTPAAAALNGHEPLTKSGENDGGVPLYRKIEGRVKINLNTGSKSEIKELKRKLVSELDQVRRVVKVIEAKEIQINGYSGPTRYTYTEFSAMEPEPVDMIRTNIRINSNVGSVGVPDSWLIDRGKGLSVSAAENSYGFVGEFVEQEKRTPKANQFYRNSEFILGKKKVTPPKRMKLNGGRKRKSNGGRKNGDKRGSGFGSNNYLSNLFKSCVNLLTKLMKHKYGWFNKPVDVKGLGLHDYYAIVKHPMDLGTVKGRLNKNWYKSPREFAEDVRLTFSNAMLYNPKGHDVHIMAEQLLNIFEVRWGAIEAKCDLDRRFEMGCKSSLLMPISRKVLAPPLPPPAQPEPLESGSLDRSEEPMLKPVSYGHPDRTSVPKTPKGMDPDKRNMTLEEKHRLTENLQRLPPEKMENIALIIKKRNPGLFQNDDEVEVDLDTFDSETLWELDRYVAKDKREAELALQARTEAGHTTQHTKSAPAIAEAPNAIKTVEKYVTGASHAQEKPGDDVRESSSSSSDSGSSSSSDSDSDSSSRSDGDH